VPPQPWTPREPSKQPVPAGEMQETIPVVSINKNA
jgi:hypothetical protein